MNEEGKGKIDLNACEVSATYRGRTYRLRAFSEYDCFLMVTFDGQEVYCSIKQIEELTYSQEVPDVINWLARMLRDIPARYKQAAFRCSTTQAEVIR